jgi:heme-degrading monooxygenase HmoA
MVFGGAYTVDAKSCNVSIRLYALHEIRNSSRVEEHVIARIWGGVIPAPKREKYLELLRGTALPTYLATSGNRGGWYLYRTEGDVTRFERLTFWDNYDAIKGFAGADYDLPKYWHFDSDYLTAAEPRVRHYEVRFSASNASAPSRGTAQVGESGVARVWRGVVPLEKAEAYLGYLADFGFRDYQSYPGFCAGHLLSRAEQVRVHVLLLSFWHSRQAIVDYAGANIEQAHYYPYDLECLIDPPPNVEHFEVLSSSVPGPR